MKRLVIILLSCVSLALFFGGRSFWNWLTTDLDKYNFEAQQYDGSVIAVEVTRLKKGFFINGGHGLSIGSTVESYEMLIDHMNVRILWSGPGAPFVLQRDKEALFLVTFDRETEFPRATFRCYKWKDGWENIAQESFPKHLAIDNLLNFDSSPTSRPDSEEFRTSMLAKLWFCLANKTEYWRVSDSMMSKDFVMQFYKKWIDPGKYGAGDMKHGKSRVPAAFPGEK